VESPEQRVFLGKKEFVVSIRGHRVFIRLVTGDHLKRMTPREKTSAFS
jgi:hypothetical protein